MSEFKAIETQEQFDQIIGERIKREKESLAKKYEGYLDPEGIKKLKEDHDKVIADLSKALDEAKGKVANHDKEVADLAAKIKGYETASVKTRIAHEVGIPFELANRLTGEDEDAIRKDAESVKGLIGQTHTAPLASTEPGGVSNKTGETAKTDAALRGMLQNMKGD